MEEARAFIFEKSLKSFDFGPLSLYFKHRILAHIIATTLVLRKGSLNNISSRDVFILYYLLKKYRINWAKCIMEYMMENVKDSNPSASLPKGLLISQILSEP